MTVAAGGADSELVSLKAQLEALTDFVVTVTAALVADRALAGTIVQALLDEGSSGSPSSVTAATIAHDVLAIAGRASMPSPVRLVYSADDQDSS